MNQTQLVHQIEHWPIDRLIPYARNARTHSDAQVAQIAASIREFGFNAPILVDTSSGVIAGHGRLLAARKLKLTEIPVIVLDHLTENQKRAYILADNRIADAAGWDEEALRLELAALAEEDVDLSLTGFEKEELARLLDIPDEHLGTEDENAIPEKPAQAVSRRGDLWVLGDHRLLCGDSTIAAEVDHLMGPEKADLVFDDRPYNVRYEGYTDDRLRIEGDMNARTVRAVPSEYFQELPSSD